MHDITNVSIEQLFTYHTPDESQLENLKIVRATAKLMAYVLDSSVPVCADQAAAMRLLRECVMTANAAIVLNGQGYEPTVLTS